MARRATFSGLEPYTLTKIVVTGRQLGYGSYATVQELEYMGLKCAGKKIHELLLEQGGASYTVRRFEEECRLLSQTRHPNIVQFLGVHFQKGVPAPILVMEFLPTNLTSCIEQYGILPKDISYSILHDVALGLHYLHSQTPPIIHRDLSSNNVLLTPNMTAKISDLGVARILNLTPLQVSRMTQTPGTPAYMPPEVMIANPKYNTSIDVFSYGILMIHTLSGRWPEPQVGQTQVSGVQLVPVTEAERREVFLRAIGNDHPLMEFILRCINNDPKRRAHASDIVDRMAEMVLQFPACFVNRLEMLRQIEHLEENRRVLREGGEAENQRKGQQISNLRKENEEKAEEIVRLHDFHPSEVEELKLKVQDLSARNQFLIAKQEADGTEMQTKVTVYEAQVENYEKALKQEREKCEVQRMEYKIQLERERELTSQLSTEISQSATTTTTLQHNNLRLEAELSRKDATIHRHVLENLAKTRFLEEKEDIISGMSKQLAKATELLTLKQQVSL